MLEKRRHASRPGNSAILKFTQHIKEVITFVVEEQRKVTFKVLIPALNPLPFRLVTADFNL